MSLSMIAWVSAAALTLIVVTLPAGDRAQTATAGLLLIAMGLLVRFGRGRPVRLAVLAAGAAITGRYVYWRTTATLPPVSDLADFIPGILLYGAEMFSILTMFVSLFVVADPLVRKPPAPRRDEDLPTVDVFVPSYNEEAELVAVTLAAARSMDYPADKLKVFLLDDGGTDEKCRAADPVKAAAARRRRAEFARLAADLGVHYVARERNEHAKAGNLNAGLARSAGEIVVVFDADHAPVRSFLRETIGHFAGDQRLFLVQTPHIFLNPDPIEKNLGTFGRMPSENEMFYGTIQRGLDKWNAAFFCGSAALLRRTALMEAGGFSGITITEDCETALDLHARGWHSLYVDKPLIAGLQPESFESFIGQRSRWCRGMIQILLLKNPLFRSGLALSQRISYASNALFWLFPLPRLAFMMAPLLYLFFDVKLYVADISSFVGYAAAYLGASLIVQNYLHGRVRWPWISELYEYVQSLHLAAAIVSVIRNPRKPTFNVTAKNETLDRDHLSPLAGPHLAVVVLLAAGVVMTGWRWQADPATADLTLFVGAWNLFNLSIASIGLGALVERRQRRRTHRLKVERTGVLEIGDVRMNVAIRDASPGGAAVRLLEPAGRALVAGDMGLLSITPLDGRSEAPRALVVAVRRAGAQACGVEFARLEAADYPAVAELMFGDPGALDRFVQGRRTGSTLVGGTFGFFARAPGEALRALRILLDPPTRPAAPQPEPERAGPRAPVVLPGFETLVPVAVRREA